MEPITALGAAAAVGQIAQQGVTLLFKLVELYKSSKKAKVTVSEYVSQLKRVKAITDDMTVDAHIGTNTLKLSLDGCLIVLKEINGELTKLLDGFKKGRLWQISTSLITVMKEPHIENLFAKLDRCKVDLLLGLGHDNSKLTRIIDTKVDNMSAVHSQPPASARPMIWKVPSSHVRSFVGREAILQQLYTTLTLVQNSSQGSLTTIPMQRRSVLLGMGGQGKTQIALRFCHICRRDLSEDLEGIFWMDASSEASLRASYKSLADTLIPNADHVEDDVLIERTKSTIETFEKSWLMVLDNFDRPDEFDTIEDYIPDNYRGSVLITSRHADAGNLVADSDVELIEVSGLDLESAQQLLNMLSTQKVAIGDHTAVNVVNLLGCHPLAITQAAAFIKKRKIAYADFQDHYDRSKFDILNNTPALTRYRKKGTDAEAEVAMNVFTTWEMSYAHVKAGGLRSHSQSDFLHITAFVGGIKVSENLFRRYKERVKATVAPHKFLERWLDTYLSQQEQGKLVRNDQRQSLEHDFDHDQTPRFASTSEVLPGTQIFEWSPNPPSHDTRNINETTGDDPRSHCTVANMAIGTAKINSQLQSETSIGANYGEPIFQRGYRGRLWDQGTFVDDVVHLHDLSVLQDYQLDSQNLYQISLHPLVQDWLVIRCGVDEQYKYFSAASDLVANYVNESYTSTTSHHDMNNEERRMMLDHMANLGRILKAWNLYEDDSNDRTSPLHHPGYKTFLRQVFPYLSICAGFCAITYESGLCQSILKCILLDSMISNLSVNMLHDIPYLPIALKSHSQFLIHERQYESAEKLNRTLQHVYAEEYGIRSGAKVAASMDLGQALHFQDRNEEACAVYELAAEHTIGLAPPYHWMELHCRGELAWCKSEAGHCVEAEELFRTILEFASEGGASSSIVLVIQYKFAHSLVKWGKYDEGLELMRNNVNNCVQHWGENAPDTLNIVMLFKEVLVERKEFEEAAEIEERFGKYWAQSKPGAQEA